MLRDLNGDAGGGVPPSAPLAAKPRVPPLVEPARPAAAPVTITPPVSIVAPRLPKVEPPPSPVPAPPAPARALPAAPGDAAPPVEPQRAASIAPPSGPMARPRPCDAEPEPLPPAQKPTPAPPTTPNPRAPQYPRSLSEWTIGAAAPPGYRVAGAGTSTERLTLVAAETPTLSVAPPTPNSSRPVVPQREPDTMPATAPPAARTAAGPTNPAPAAPARATSATPPAGQPGAAAPVAGRWLYVVLAVAALAGMVWLWLRRKNRS